MPTRRSCITSRRPVARWAWFFSASGWRRAERAARAAAPVVVAAAHAPGRLQRVLLAVDGSEHAAQAVRHLIALRQNLREPAVLDVHLINVQRPVTGDVSTFVANATLEDYYRETAKRR